MLTREIRLAPHGSGHSVRKSDPTQSNTNQGPSIPKTTNVQGQIREMKLAPTRGPNATPSRFCPRSNLVSPHLLIYEGNFFPSYLPAEPRYMPGFTRQSQRSNSCRHRGQNLTFLMEQLERRDGEEHYLVHRVKVHVLFITKV